MMMMMRMSHCMTSFKKFISEKGASVNFKGILLNNGLIVSWSACYTFKWCIFSQNVDFIGTESRLLFYSCYLHPNTPVILALNPPHSCITLLLCFFFFFFFRSSCNFSGLHSHRMSLLSSKSKREEEQDCRWRCSDLFPVDVRLV